MIEAYSKEADDTLRDAVRRMSLEEKVGQLLMLAPTQDGDLAALDQLIARFKPGSILFWGEESSPAKLARRMNAVQEISGKHRGLPMWVHGYVKELGWSGSWQAAIPGVATVEEVARAARLFGRRWRAVGLHNFPAPTLNVPLFPTCIMRDWAMTGDTDRVTAYGAAIVRGLRDARVGAMAQHFPAHGATAADSHKEHPVVSLSREELMRDHIRPYQEAFAAGCATICTAHLACPALDPDPRHMATTSRLILTDFLRGELGFKGITIADAIQMKGFQKNGPPQVVVVDAVRAGCDSICSMREEEYQPVYDSLLEAARTGVLTEERLCDAALRQLRFMAWLGLFDNALVDAEQVEAVLADSADNAFLNDINMRLKTSALT